MKTTLAVSALAILGGCFIDAPTPAYPIASRAGGLSERDAMSAAREVTRLMEVRGYAMLDQQATSKTDGLVLKFGKSNHGPIRYLHPDPIAAGGVGSVFYVWIAPRPAGGSSIAMLGKPTLGGVEPCTRQDEGLPCDTIDVDAAFVATYLSGRDEADVVHGVLSELAFEGYVTKILPGPADDTAPHAACVAEATAILDEASRIPDLDKRAELLDAMPRCDALALAGPAGS